MNLLLKGGIVVDPSRNLNKRNDILILNGRIEEIAEDLSERLPAGCPVEDVTGKYLVPGLIDMHVHFRDPGFEAKETIATGAAAALAGGFTSVVCMPNTKPVIDSAETVELVKSKGEAAGCRIYMMGSITKGLTGLKLSPYRELKDHGVVGITDDGYSVMDSGVLFEGMKEAARLGLTVSSHCEDTGLTFDRSINAGAVADSLNLKGVPALAEEIIIQRDIMIAEKTGASLHIQHISSAKGVDLVRQAKAKGLKVSAEAAPHHFSLTDEAVKTKGTNAKMSPPLRTADDVEAVRRGLADGTIDAIATDHAPHTDEDKGSDLVKGANGVIGLETSLGLSLKYLVDPGILSLPDLIDRMSCAPAKLLNLPGGTLAAGVPADITVIDLDKKWTVDDSCFHGKSRNTPFEGEALKGRAVMTIVEGKIVFRD